MKRAMRVDVRTINVCVRSYGVVLIKSPSERHPLLSTGIEIAEDPLSMLQRKQRAQLVRFFTGKVIYTR